MPVQTGTPAGESKLLRGHFLTALCRLPRFIGPAGNSGQIVDMKELGVWEPYQVGGAWAASLATAEVSVDDAGLLGSMVVHHTFPHACGPTTISPPPLCSPARRSRCRL